MSNLTTEEAEQNDRNLEEQAWQIRCLRMRPRTVPKAYQSAE